MAERPEPPFRFVPHHQAPDDPGEDPTDPPPAEPIPLALGGAHPVVAALEREALPVVSAVRPIEPRGRRVTLMHAEPPAGRTPVLLLHHAGAGRAMLLALDLGTEAGGEFGRWPALPALLAQAVRFLGPPPPPPAVVTTSVQYAPAPAEPHRAVYAHATWTVEGGPAGADFALDAGPRDGTDGAAPIRLTRTGPRRWEARLPAPEPGELLQLAAVVSLEGEELARGRLAAVRPPAPESLARSDAAACAALAAETGGTLDPNGAAIAAQLPVPVSRESLAWWCWLAAIGLFLPVAVGVRRV